MIIYLIFLFISLVLVALLLTPILRSENFSRSQKKWLLLVFVFVFSGGSLGLYSYFGAPEIIPALAKRDDRLTQLKSDIKQNSEIIKVEPKNLKAWIALGDNFMETGQFSSARNAFKQTVLLSGGHPVLIMALARAIIAEEDGKVSDEAATSLKMVLMLDAENEEARYFLALRKFQTGDTQNAMQEMKTLYQSLPDGSPIRTMIDRQIGRK